MRREDHTERTPENMLLDMVKLWVDKSRLGKKEYKERMDTLKMQIEYWAFRRASKAKIGPKPVVVMPEDTNGVIRDANSGNYVAVLTPQEYEFIQKRLGSTLRTPVSLTTKFGIE